MSRGWTVYRRACIANRLASSITEVKYASIPSWTASVAPLVHLKGHTFLSPHSSFSSSMSGAVAHLRACLLTLHQVISHTSLQKTLRKNKHVRHVRHLNTLYHLQYHFLMYQRKGSFGIHKLVGCIAFHIILNAWVPRLHCLPPVGGL